MAQLPGSTPSVSLPEAGRHGGDASRGASRGAGGGAVALERLSRLERRVSAQAAALSAVPLSEPVPRSVLALLATPAHDLDGVDIPPYLRPRLATMLTLLASMADDVALRQRRLAGRIATVRAARRAGPAPNLLDTAG